MTARRIWTVPPRELALFALLVSATHSVLGCSSAATGSPESPPAGSDGGTSMGTSPQTDHLVLQAGALSYTYDCAAQSVDLMSDLPRIVTAGCAWPASSPHIELDFDVTARTGMQDVAVDLSAANAPGTIVLYVGLSQQADLNNESIYASSDQSGLDVAPGTTGTVTVRSYEPTSGKMDITLSNITLPLSEINSYPGAPSSVTIESAEIVR